MKGPHPLTCHFIAHSNEVGSSIYNFYYFQIINTQHINTWHVAKHLIVIWHVINSFFLVKLGAQLLFQLFQNNGQVNMLTCCITSHLLNDIKGSTIYISRVRDPINVLKDISFHWQIRPTYTCHIYGCNKTYKYSNICLMKYRTLLHGVWGLLSCNVCIDNMHVCWRT
jgi:hypothetical protein